MVGHWAHRLKWTGLSPLADAVKSVTRSLAERLGITRVVVIAQSRLVTSPSLVGHLKPMILLPFGIVTGLSTREFEAIIAHELAHVRRHDYLVNLGQTLIETLLFFHPAIWWISRRVRIEREHCCDDIAVKVTTHPIDYIRALTSLAERRAGHKMHGMEFYQHGPFGRWWPQYRG